MRIAQGQSLILPFADSLSLLSRILVIRGGAVGDFILTLPALRLLRAGFPGAHIEILGYQHIAALARLAGCADTTGPIEYGPLASFFVVGRALPPDLVEYFAGFDYIISYLFDPDEIFAGNLRRCGVRNFIAGPAKITGPEHAALQLARPLEKLGLSLVDAAASIPLERSERQLPSVIAIHPGSGSEKKNWPLAHFAALLRKMLLPNEKQRLILIEGEADAERVAALRRLLPKERITCAQNPPLTELARLLRDCALFLGHDSGVSHLAAAVGTPCLLLFGPTDPAIWAPLNPQVKVLRAPGGRMSDLTVAQAHECLTRMNEGGFTELTGSGT